MMHVETVQTMAPFYVLGVCAHPGASRKELVLSKREVATLRSAERIAIKARKIVAGACGHQLVERSGMRYVDMELARLEHAAAGLADDGGVVLS